MNITAQFRSSSLTSHLKRHRPNGPIRFFSEIAEWKDLPEYCLSERELEGLSANERKLIEVMVDLYRTGAITGVETYSGACHAPEERIQHFIDLQKKRVKGPRASHTEAFVFAMYGASSDSEDFMARHRIQKLRSGIDEDSVADPDLRAIAKYVTRIAKTIPGSGAFYDPNAPTVSHWSADGQFSFSLSGRAAKAMHKINLAVNPRCRGSGF